MQGIIDIHCHILPGIDDGAETVKEAQEKLGFGHEKYADFSRSWHAPIQ